MARRNQKEKSDNFLLCPYLLILSALPRCKSRKIAFCSWGESDTLFSLDSSTDYEEHALRIVQQEMNKTGGTAAAAAAGAAAGGMAVPPMQPGMMMPGVLVPPLLPPGAPGPLQALPLPGMMMPPGAPGGAGMPGIFIHIDIMILSCCPFMIIIIAQNNYRDVACCTVHYLILGNFR